MWRRVRSHFFTRYNIKTTSARADVTNRALDGAAVVAPDRMTIRGMWSVVAKTSPAKDHILRFVTTISGLLRAAHEGVARVRPFQEMRYVALL